MASQPECEQALATLAARLAELDPDVRGKYAVTRTVACRIPDLEIVFLASVGDTGMEGLRWQAGLDMTGAQVRLSTQSDDLVSIVEGRLSAPTAWATGRLKVEASVLDLLKLRALL